MNRATYMRRRISTNEGRNMQTDSYGKTWHPHYNMGELTKARKAIENLTVKSTKQDTEKNNVKQPPRTTSSTKRDSIRRRHKTTEWK